jgi:hypothetical protein
MNTDNKPKKNLLKGPSMGYTDVFPKRELWKEIVKEFSGEFKVQYNSSKELERHLISIPYKDWKLMISVSDTKPLKFHIQFLTDFDFNFNITWEDFIERILKKFRKPELQIGNKTFDKKYLLQTNNSELFLKVITSSVQNVILTYNIYSLSYQTNIRKERSELMSVIQRHAGNKEMILELIDMFTSIIDTLDRLRVIRKS